MIRFETLNCVFGNDFGLAPIKHKPLSVTPNKCCSNHPYGSIPELPILPILPILQIINWDLGSGVIVEGSDKSITISNPQLFQKLNTPLPIGQLKIIFNNENNQKNL